jgi:hypothetical protein
VIRCAISQQSCRKRAACLLLDLMPVASHDGMCSLARHKVLRDRTAGRARAAGKHDDGSSNRASRNRCTRIARPWRNPKRGATTYVVVHTTESSNETVCWIGRRP